MYNYNFFLLLISPQQHIVHWVILRRFLTGGLERQVSGKFLTLPI